MSKENNLTEFLSNLADAVRSSLNISTPLNASQTAASIDHIGSSLVDFIEDPKTISAAELDNVTTIKKYAFMSCANLSSVSISDTVLTIDNNAFDNCSTLTSVDIPNSVTSINISAFRNCSSLSHVVLPDSVTCVATQTFTDCTNLSSIQMPGNLTTMSGLVFMNCHELKDLVIPDSLSCISTMALRGTSLQNLSIPYVGSTQLTPEDNYQYPLGYIFGTISYPNASAITQSYYGYPSIQSTTYYIPSSLRKVAVSRGYILGGAFSNCAMLTDIELKDAVGDIACNAFINCANLANITIGNGVTSVGENAFFGCPNLSKVNIHDIAAWCNISFNNSFFESNPLNIAGHLYLNDELLTDLVIPSSISTIKAYAFVNASDLQSVTLGNNITSTGIRTFSWCTNLSSVHYTGLLDEWCRMQFGYPDGNPLAFAHNLYIGDQLVTDVVLNSTTYPGFGAFTNATCIVNVSLSNEVVNSTAFYGCTGLTNLSLNEGVVDIQTSAFSRCSGLIEVNLPTTVANIGTSAFYCCSNLATVVINNKNMIIGDSALENCTSLTNILYNGSYAEWLNVPKGSYWDYNTGKYTITGSEGIFDEQGLLYRAFSSDIYAIKGYIGGNTSFTIPTLIGGHSVSMIDNLAFANSSTISVLSIPDSITSLGSSACCNCTSLTDVNLGNGMTRINSNTFYECSNLANVAVGNNITSIDTFAFAFCSNLTSIIIPDSVMNIGEYSFESCTNLATISIGNNVRNIMNGAFSFCRSLTSVDLPDSTVNIGDSAFKYCLNLSHASIGNNVTSIGNDAFIYCSNLSNVSIGNGVTTIGNSAFYNCSTLSNVTFIADSHLGYIDWGAFMGCSNLVSLELPGSVVTIEYNAFQRCLNLANITIPDNVTSIGDRAFLQCSNMASAIIGSSVTFIDNYAFKDCHNLAQITVKNINPPTLGTNVFYNVASSCLIYVPNGYLSAYQTAWSEYASMLRESGPVIDI